MTHIIAITEGVSLDLLKASINNYDLPWWKKNIRENVIVDMDCGPVPYEPSHLASAFTGTTPGHHGCYSYWDARPSNETPSILMNNDVRSPRIWEWDSTEKIDFAVVNIALTHPPKKIHGSLISYPMNQSLHVTYPRELQLALSKKEIRCAQDVSAFYQGEARNELSEKIFMIAENQFNAAYELGKSADILIVNLTIADRFSHFFWDEVMPNQQTDYTPYIIQAYQFLDQALQKLEGLQGANDSMLVFSEIGFGPIKSFVSIDKLLQKNNLQQADENIINYKHSIACESVQGSHGINILTENLCCDRDSDQYDRYVSETISCLLNLKHEDLEPVVKNAWHANDIYPGPYSQLAPDIIIEPFDKSRPPLGDFRWANHVNRHLQTGWHRDEGFCFLKSTVEKFDSEKTQIPIKPESIAPTIAAILNIKTPDSVIADSLLKE